MVDVAYSHEVERPSIDGWWILDNVVTVIEQIIVFMANFTARYGRQAITDLLHDSGTTVAPVRLGTGGNYAYIGSGTGTVHTTAGTAPSGHNDLATASTEARVIGTPTQGTDTYTDDKITFTGTITYGGTKTITEVAVFSGAGTGSPPSGGNMFCYAGLASSQAVNNTDQIAFTITWIIA